MNSFHEFILYYYKYWQIKMKKQENRSFIKFSDQALEYSNTIQSKYIVRIYNMIDPWMTDVCSVSKVHNLSKMSLNIPWLHKYAKIIKIFKNHNH